jgi:DNA-binding NtrC family response regulator
MRFVDRLFRWLRRRRIPFVGYALIVSRDVELTRLLADMLMDVDLYSCCFPDVDAVKEAVRRAIPFRLLILDLPTVENEDVRILCRTRSNRLVPFILLGETDETKKIHEAGIEERYVYLVPKPIDTKRLRETILIARLQTA